VCVYNITYDIIILYRIVRALTAINLNADGMLS